MFQLCFLGTMSAVPTPQRALNSTLLVHDGNKYLIDCGEGVQQRLLQSGLGFAGLSNIFITHGHVDHFLGLAGLLLAFDNFSQNVRLNVYASSHALPLLQGLVSLCEFRGKLEISWHEIREGIILQHEQLIVSAFPLVHTVPCYGFTFEQPARRQFLVKAAETHGVPKEQRGVLKRGGSITLKDGRKIVAEDVLGPAVAGCKVVYIADTKFHENLLEISKGASCLISEATYLDSDKTFAEKYYHLTTKDAAKLAHIGNVRGFVANHLSHRYAPSEIAAELQQIYPDAIVPNDLDLIKVTVGGGAQLVSRNMELVRSA